MRTLGSKADDARALAHYGELCGLKVEFGGSIGDKWYTSGWTPSDVSSADIRERVSDWGEISAVLERDSQSLAQAAASVASADPDGELRGWFEDNQLQRLPCELHWALWTPGEAEPTTAQSVRILRGTLVPPISWSDAMRELTCDITDLASRHSSVVGFRCTRERFSSIGEDEEGRACPIVYGRPDKVSPVYLNGGARCRLAAAIDDDDTTIYVDDSEGFPQDESIDIRIGREVITGSFHGNTFTATARGKVLVSSTTSHDSGGNCTIRDTSLSGYDDNAFVGYGLEIDVDPYPYGNASVQGSFVALMPVHTYLGTPATEQLRDIIRYDASTDTIEFAAPFVLEGTVEAKNAWAEITGNEVWINAGTSYKIRTLPQRHDAGAEVSEWAASAEYAVGLDECSVRNVYVKGVRKLLRSITILGPHTVYGGDASTIAEHLMGETFQPAKAVEPAWIPLPGEHWTTELVQASFGDYTKLTLRVPPTFLAGYEIETDAVQVDVSGPTDDAGDVIVNPADVIEHLYLTYGDLGTNQLQRPDEFDQSPWAATRASVSADDAVAPNGETTADKLVEDSSASMSHYVKQAGCDADGASQYRIKVRAKADERSKIIAMFLSSGFSSSAWAKFDLSAGTVHSSGAAATPSITSLGSGWYLCEVLATSTGASSSAGGHFGLLDASGMPLYNGDGSSGAHLWRAEFERVADPVVADAKSSLSRWAMDFAREDVVELNCLAAELAYRARSRIRWLGEAPELLYQKLGGDADLAVGRSRVIEDSPVATREELELAASEVTVTWVENGRLKRHTERDKGVESAIGHRGVEIDCWCYDSRECPTALARFVLQRTRKLHDLALVDLTPFGVQLEPDDILELDTDLSVPWPSAALKAQVLEVAHVQGKAPSAPDRVRVRARAFRWAGCTLSCEANCETTGCETSCESYFQPDNACWTCETSCEAHCQIWCTTAAEHLCGDMGCEAAVTTGCALICQVAAMAGCGSCESYCQSDCESAGCETGGET
ncbi:MAG: phage head spike fiber domain-containing protein [Planctomycetota bacterium]|jgi:hypothetical protein